MIRCAESTCGPTGKLTKRGKKRSADATKRRKRAGKPKRACWKEQTARQALEAELRDLRQRGR